MVPLLNIGRNRYSKGDVFFEISHDKYSTAGILYNSEDNKTIVVSEEVFKETYYPKLRTLFPDEDIDIRWMPSSCRIFIFYDGDISTGRFLNMLSDEPDNEYPLKFTDLTHREIRTKLVQLKTWFDDSKTLDIFQQLFPDL